MRKAHSRHHHEKLALRVSRTRLLHSSMKATKGFSTADWCRNFEVTFQGEQGYLLIFLNKKLRNKILYDIFHY